MKLSITRLQEILREKSPLEFAIETTDQMIKDNPNLNIDREATIRHFERLAMRVAPQKATDIARSMGITVKEN